MLNERVKIYSTAVLASIEDMMQQLVPQQTKNRTVRGGKPGDRVPIDAYGHCVCLAGRRMMQLTAGVPTHCDRVWWDVVVRRGDTCVYGRDACTM